MLEALTCLKDWEDGSIGLQTLEDECKENLEKLDLNTDKDVQEIDDDWRWRMKMEKQEWRLNKHTKVNMIIEELYVVCFL